MTRNTDPGRWFGSEVAPGARAALSLVVTENYAGEDVSIPIHVWRGMADGPTVCITAAVHGDEINGTGAIRHILSQRPFNVLAGTLVLVPVVNRPGFERHTRYLPDRRDLNRSFPGYSKGSLASRMAASFFGKVIARCDYCIDLHTAAVRRTNFPNVRADMSDERLAAFARAFGTELIVSGKGPRGSLRLAACKAGCATLILEAGEVWRVEGGVVEYAVRGIGNCLRYLGMVEGEPIEPPYRVETDATKWVRARNGGFLEFHVSPGEIVEEGDAIATNTDLAGTELNVLRSPRDGIVLGMTTIPSVAPGDPVCHLAFPKASVLRKAERAVDRLGEDTLHERVRDDLARGVWVIEPEES
ncbi:MAG: succinylglutamate desuccinylase/aspartoacylase family protein [Phycisphaeraceae bacterium]|nr:MAG: succinylglutamate desuccinylase/aspartoacylase family protein [Phycisphaeraceae bacterium]